MSDDDTRICWLAAFAMGLAVSSHSPRDRVDELVEACDGDRAALRAAGRRVRRLGLGDPEVRRTAADLLARAAQSAEDDGLELVVVPGAVEARG